MADKQLVKNRGAGRPTREDSAIIREVILTAALAEFSERGFHGGSISNIALRSGVSRVTIYKHFATKEELLEQLAEHNARRLRAALVKAVHPDKPCPEVLVDVGRCFYQDGLFLEARAISRVLVMEAERLPELVERGLLLRHVSLEPLTEYLTEMTRRGILAIDDAPRAAQQLLHLTTSSIDFLFGRVLNSRRERDDWVNAAVNTFLYGVKA